MSNTGEKKKRSGCRTALLVLLVILALFVIAGVIFFKIHEQDIRDALSTIDCPVPVGEAAPDFEVTTTDGESLSMQGLLEGKDALVVVLFATWCGPCEKEFPFMD
jgi:flagellar basal body-associated protein FliL